MPLTDVEVSRIADAIAGARPDWPARSTRALIAAKLRDRAFADVLVALAVVAADPTSETPARVLEPGPWWQATRANRPTDATFTPGPGAAAPHDWTEEPTGLTCTRCGTVRRLGESRAGTCRGACTRPGHEHERAAACRLCRAETLTGDQPDHPARPIPAPTDWRTRKDHP